MKILQIGKYHSSYGGIETHIASLSEQLSERGIQVTTIASSLDGTISCTQKQNHISYAIPHLGQIFNTSISPKQIYLVYKLHKLHKFDIVHIHLPNPLAHLACLFLPKCLPIVITWHSDIKRYRVLLFFYMPFLKSIMKRCAAIIAFTEPCLYNSYQISKKYKENKGYIINYGLDVSRISHKVNFNIKDEFEKYNTELNIFALGRHVKYKGYKYLIEAIKNLNVKLIIGGEGPLTKELKKLTRNLNIENKVIFTGEIETPLLSSYFQLSDIFVLPSISQAEAFGLVQLEAMYHGLPIISTRLNNGTNILNQHMKTGLIVEPKNVAELESAIKKLFDKSLRKKLSLGAKNFVEQNFSLDEMTINHIDLYSKLTNLK